MTISTLARYVRMQIIDPQMRRYHLIGAVGQTPVTESDSNRKAAFDHPLAKGAMGARQISLWKTHSPAMKVARTSRLSLNTTKSASPPKSSVPLRSCIPSNWAGCKAAASRASTRVQSKMEMQFKEWSNHSAQL